MWIRLRTLTLESIIKVIKSSDKRCQWQYNKTWVHKLFEKKNTLELWNSSSSFTDEVCDYMARKNKECHTSECNPMQRLHQLAVSKLTHSTGRGNNSLIQWASFHIVIWVASPFWYRSKGCNGYQNVSRITLWHWCGIFDQILRLT